MTLFKKFISYYRPYLFLFYMDLFCALVVSVIDLSFPLILNTLNKGIFLGEADDIIGMIGYVGVALHVKYGIRYYAK